MENLNALEIIKKIALSLEPKFEMTDENIDIYRNLSNYFINSSEFEGDLNKGILLIGGYRSGKTLAMEILNKFANEIQSKKWFAIYDLVDINTVFANQGYNFLDSFNKHYDICIDDLGMDFGKTNHFGQTEDPVSILLYKREKVFRINRTKTHGTTNLDVNGLKERFSGKIFERILEMFNIITFDHEPWGRRK
jgi:hypothetical protein